jgi:sporulation protein YtfJ
MIDQLVKTVLEELKQITQTETVIGEPIHSGAVTLVPVSKVSIGFGVGGGKGGSKNGEGEGTGGGISIEPLAFLVIRENKVELVTLKKDSAGLGQIVDLIPQVVDKIKDFRNKKSGKQADSGRKKS